VVKLPPFFPSWVLGKKLRRGIYNPFIWPGAKKKTITNRMQIPDATKGCSWK